MPSGERVWLEAARDYAEYHPSKLKPTVGQYNTFRVLRAWPGRLAQIGAKVTCPADVTADMVRRWKLNPMGSGDAKRGIRPMPLKRSTAFQALWILRGFLKANGNKIARDEELWAFDKGNTERQRYYTLDQIDRLFHAARGRERIVVALAAKNGLRREEITKVRVGDVDVASNPPTILVHGKGRHGGREERIPLAPEVAVELLPHVFGKKPSDPVYPAAYRTVAYDVEHARVRAGLPPISAHDLRASFGRTLYYGGVPPVHIKNLMRHRSLDMTLHYIGVDRDQMATALASVFGRPTVASAAQDEGSEKRLTEVAQ